MNIEELTRYKNMSVEDIDKKIVPDIKDIRDKSSVDLISMYFMKVGNVLVNVVTQKMWCWKFRGLFSIIFAEESNAD